MMVGKFFVAGFSSSTREKLPTPILNRKLDRQCGLCQGSFKASFKAILVRA
jgi:hypothetical protein